MKRKIIAVGLSIICFMNFLTVPYGLKITNNDNFKKKRIVEFKSIYDKYLEQKEAKIEAIEAIVFPSLENFQLEVSTAPPSVVQPIRTLSNEFSAEEINLIYTVVQAEVDGCDFDSKANVASVIFNRYRQYKANNIYEILNGSQFESMSNGAHRRVIVDDETKLACEFAWECGDTTGGAIYFDSTNGKSWAARNKKWLFRDNAGHDFYSEEDKER